MLNCPKCQASMKSVCSKKRDVVIEQCHSCRGYWLDKNEIFKFVKNKLDLEKYHFDGLIAPKPTEQLCPRCVGQKLEQGTIPTLNFEIERCNQCEGIFLDHGELHQMIHEQTLAAKGAAKRKPVSWKHGLPDFFKRVLDDDEKVFWAQKPDILSYLFSSVQFFLPMIALIAGFRLGVFSHAGQWLESGVILCLVIALGYLYLRYRNTFYVLTNKRSIISSGFLGIDFTSIDHAKVTDLFLNVSLIDRLLGCGSVRIHTASTQPTRHLNHIKGFVGINDPYESYKLIKSLTYRKT